MTDTPSAGPTQAQAYAPRPMLESEARTWSMLTHLLAAAGALLSAGTIGFLAPLVIWLLFKERSALVDHHGKQNLNLQITVLVGGVAAVVLGLLMLIVGLVITIPLWILYALYAFIISIVAAVRANNGEYYRIPLVIRFIK